MIGSWCGGDNYLIDVQYNGVDGSKDKRCERRVKSEVDGKDIRFWHVLRTSHFAPQQSFFDGSVAIICNARHSVPSGTIKAATTSLYLFTSIDKAAD